MTLIFPSLDVSRPRPRDDLNIGFKKNNEKAMQSVIKKKPILLLRTPQGHLRIYNSIQNGTVHISLFY